MPMNQSPHRKPILLIYLTLFVSLLLCGTAHAYIDPGTTSYLVQIIAGLFITIGVGIGIFWKKIRLFFRSIRLKMLEKKLTRQADKAESRS